MTSLVRSLLVAFAGIGVGLASTASAADIVNHGSLCHPARLDITKIDYTQFGVHNVAATPATVSCGAAVPILATINHVGVEVYDRNPADNVVCTLFLVDIFGNNVAPPQQRSSAGSGAAAQFLSFNPAVRTHTANLQCRIPAATASGVSLVTTYRVIHN
jgi:hypothetical protein